MNSKKEIRNNFRHGVFSRDGHRCKIKGCPCSVHIDAHHITDRSEMPNGGYVLENGITLCTAHHYDAEKFHRTHGAEWVIGMHPDDLYDLIGSSKEKALKASEILKRD